MAIRKINVQCLTPSDNIRGSSQSFFDALTFEDFQKLGVPEVWCTPEFPFLVSDGNNRISKLVSMGFRGEVVVDYKDASSTRFAYILDESKQRAVGLAQQGINSFYDLVKSQH